MTRNQPLRRNRLSTGSHPWKKAVIHRPHPLGIRATVTSIQERISQKSGGKIFLMTFKDEEGGTYLTWLDPANRNYKRWESVKEGDTLGNLIVKKDTLIDADSIPEKAS